MKEKNLQFLNELLFETPGGTRFTQDSPILPPVWFAFADKPREPQELILTATNDGASGAIAQKIRNDLRKFRKENTDVGVKNPIPTSVAF